MTDNPSASGRRDAHEVARMVTVQRYYTGLRPIFLHDYLGQISFFEGAKGAVAWYASDDKRITPLMREYGVQSTPYEVWEMLQTLP